VLEICKCGRRLGAILFLEVRGVGGDALVLRVVPISLAFLLRGVRTTTHRDRDAAVSVLGDTRICGDEDTGTLVWWLFALLVLSACSNIRVEDELRRAAQTPRVLRSRSILRRPDRAP
jgi:hypothetical protein